MQTSSVTCPEANTIAEFVEGILADDAATQVEQHIDACAACCGIVAYLATADRADSAAGADLRASSLLAPGARVGRYLIIDVVGMGGMGVVYSAYDPELDRKIALKVLRPGRAENDPTLLQREAQSLARLSDPNVTAVYDVSVHAQSVFLAMELVEGQNLTAWKAEKPRTWREIRDVLRQAGRGLSAAHKAGLVHRDFKADNIVIGADGRARVTDFGLAHILGDEATALAGTPAYMAPEQRSGSAADARSDQFAFCVTFYEALYGERPGPNGRGPASGKSNRTPAWLRSALARGLAVDPQERFPSMDAVLDAIGRDSHRRSIGWLVGAAIVAIVALSLWLHGRSEPPVCRSAARQLEGVWDAPRKQAVHDAFVRADARLGPIAWTALEPALDRYAQAWVAMSTEACEATRIDGAQSDEVLSLRNGCLARRLVELRALTDQFVASDASTVRTASSATESLRALDSCRDSDNLRAPLPPPKDGAAAARVAVDRDELARVRALRDTAHFNQALTRAEALARSARDLGYRPLEAEALFELGVTQDAIADYYSAESTLIDAVAAAESVGLTEIEQSGWTALIKVSGNELENFALGQRWAELARAATEHLGGADANARFLSYRGSLSSAQGKYPEAIADLRAALWIEQASGANPLARSDTLMTLGDTLWDTEQPDAALALFREALELRTHALGPDHPGVADALYAIGDALGMRSQQEQALESYERARVIFERTLGPDSPKVAELLDRIGMATDILGRPSEGLKLVRQALKLVEQRNEAETATGAMYLAHVAFILDHLERYDESEGLYQRALAIRQRVLGPVHPDVATNLSNLGRAYLHHRHFTDALDYFRRALAIDEPRANADGIASDLVGLGHVSLELGQPNDAIAPLERALALPGLRPGRRGSVAFTLALALWAADRDRVRAVKLAEQARDDLGPAEGWEFAKMRDSIAEWLATHHR